MTDTFASTTSRSFDWTQTIIEANQSGLSEFRELIKKGVTSKKNIEEDKKGYEAREKELFELTKSNRQGPGELFVSCMVNWSLAHATDILLLQEQKKPVRTDFLSVFERQLTHEVTTRVQKIELGWAKEDERKKQEEVAKNQEEEARRAAESAAKRAESKRAYSEAYPLVEGLHHAVLDGERQRQSIFESGQEAATKWAGKYEESLKQREKELEERIKLIQQQEKENRDHQLAQRSLARADNTRSFIDAMIGTGKNTLGCLVLWILLVAVVLGALSLAMHHP